MTGRTYHRDGWRDRYEVFVAARPLREPPEWGAICRVCPGNTPSGSHWLTSAATSKRDAWELCRLHENTVHPQPQGQDNG